MLLELIIALHLKIIFTETSYFDCNKVNEKVESCYYSDDRIYLSYQGNVNKNLYHEIGHAIFLKDNFSRVIIKDYPLKYHYNIEVYKTNYDILNESVADYFAEFMMNNKEFSVRYPCLWIYFNDKIKNLILY